MPEGDCRPRIDGDIVGSEGVGPSALFQMQLSD
jgi:hypothetical protein